MIQLGIDSFQSGTVAERMPVINAARGVERTQQNLYEMAKVNEDVYFDLVEMEKIAFGQPFTVTVQIQVTILLN